MFGPVLVTTQGSRRQTEQKEARRQSWRIKRAESGLDSARKFIPRWESDNENAFLSGTATAVDA